MVMSPAAAPERTSWWHERPDGLYVVAQNESGKYRAMVCAPDQLAPVWRSMGTVDGPGKALAAAMIAADEGLTGG